MIDWKKFVPDEAFISDVEFFPPRPAKGTPPAVKNWCIMTTVVNGLLAATAAIALRHIWPLLLGAIFTLPPLYALFCWRDLASAAIRAKERADQFPFAPRINIGVQWCGIAACLGCTLMMCCIGMLLWSTQVPR